MTKRRESMLKVIWGFAVTAFWNTINLLKGTPTPIDFDILDSVSAGTELKMVFRRDATPGALLTLSLMDRRILDLDERSRENLGATIGNGYKWPNSRYRSFTMRTLPGFTRAKLVRRKLLIEGLKKLEITIQPPGKFGGNLRLVLSR